MAKKSSTTKAAAKLLSAAKGRKYSLKRSGIKRERIRTSQFAPELNWTKWYPAFQQNKPTVAEDSWSERKGKHPGFRHHNLFYHDTKCAGLYEFAVQPKPGSWKYPVWSKVTKGFNSVYWDTYLIRNGRIQNQMNDVISKGSKIFVRRAVLKTPLKVTMHHSSKRVSSVDELRKVMNEVYDYAWSRQGKKTATERDLEKSGVLISQAKFRGGNA